MEFKATVVVDDDGTWIKLTNIKDSTWSFRIRKPPKHIPVIIKALQDHHDKITRPKRKLIA